MVVGGCLGSAGTAVQKSPRGIPASPQAERRNPERNQSEKRPPHSQRHARQGRGGAGAAAGNEVPAAERAAGGLLDASPARFRPWRSGASSALEEGGGLRDGKLQTCTLFLACPRIPESLWGPSTHTRRQGWDPSMVVVVISGAHRLQRDRGPAK